MTEPLQKSPIPIGKPEGMLLEPLSDKIQTCDNCLFRQSGLHSDYCHNDNLWKQPEPLFYARMKCAGACWQPKK